MKQALAFRLKQLLKMALQHTVLPLAYGFWRLVYAGTAPTLIVLADAHHDTLPSSMENIHAALAEKGCSVTCCFHNYSAAGQLKSALYALDFMRLYAQARYVFLCDNFLPVASCKKRKDTTVVQLWHSCGLLKKIGYDASDDVPPCYRGNVYRNYDLLTVSAPSCIDAFVSGMRLAKETVLPLGISRTDSYFRRDWQEECRVEFFRQHPEARGKTVILWAPTFRGNAADPRQVGTEGIDALEKALGADFFLVRKVHPHVDAKYHLSNSPIPTERLFPAADLLISDYSSTVCEFMFFDKPCVLFAPDLEEFEKARGFYTNYRTLSPWIATEAADLEPLVRQALAGTDIRWIRQQCSFHNGACDGASTARILQYLNL